MWSLKIGFTWIFTFSPVNRSSDTDDLPSPWIGREIHSETKAAGLNVKLFAHIYERLLTGREGEEKATEKLIVERGKTLRLKCLLKDLR